MNKYINNLSYNFIDEFAKKMGLKNYSIRLETEGWYIIFDNEKLWDNNVLITDYSVQSGFGEEFCDKATKFLNEALYKIYGKKYAVALKKRLLHIENQKHAVKKEIIKERVNRILGR